LKTIADAGFQEVEVVEESFFPIESMTNDPTAQAIIKTKEIPGEELKKIANTVASVKVSAVKPKD